MKMKSAILAYVLVSCVTRVFSATIWHWPPAMQRKSIGESCTIRWNVTGNFTAYSIMLKSTSTGNPTTLGQNTNHTYDSSKGVVTLFLWNIQTSNAGYYSLSVTNGHSTEVNSAALLFVFATVSAYTSLSVGRNPGFEGDKIELNCSATSSSLPAVDRPRVHYTWRNTRYGYFRNISNGPAVLQNGDALPGYSIKNDGKTFVIASAQYTDSTFCCLAQEEDSPYISTNINYAISTIYSKPYTFSFNPVSRKFNAVLNSNMYVSLLFYLQASPPLTSYTNWSLIDASGRTTHYPVGTNPLLSSYVSLSSYLTSYGNVSITLTNSNWSTTETFQVLPPGPPDVPSSFIMQYSTHSLISLQWRCMWHNGAQQTVFVRLTDVASNTEVETVVVTLATQCYNSAYSTLFQRNIQPETDYEANIWSISTQGSSDVVKLAVKTPKRLSFDTSPEDISITGNQAAITFLITDSTKATMWLNVTCCAESAAQCTNQSYMISSTGTDNQIVYDTLPAGTEFVFDFIVYDGDGYTYMYTMAIVKGVRVSRTDSLECNPGPCGQKNIAVIVLAVLLGVAVLTLVGCLVNILIRRHRESNSHQSTTTQPPRPTRSKPEAKQPSEYDNAAADTYEAMGEVDQSKGNDYYTALNEHPRRAMVNR